MRGFSGLGEEPRLVHARRWVDEDERGSRVVRDESLGEEGGRSGRYDDRREGDHHQTDLLRELCTCSTPHIGCGRCDQVLAYGCGQAEEMVRLTSGHDLKRLFVGCRLFRSVDINLHRCIASLRKHASPSIVANCDRKSGIASLVPNLLVRYQAASTHSSFSSSAPAKPFALSKTRGVGHSLGANSLACRSKNREHLACVKVELGRVRVNGEVKMPNREMVVGFARRVKVLRRDAILVSLTDCEMSWIAGSGRSD